MSSSRSVGRTANATPVPAGGTCGPGKGRRTVSPTRRAVAVAFTAVAAFLASTVGWVGPAEAAGTVRSSSIPTVSPSTGSVGGSTGAASGTLGAGRPTSLAVASTEVDQASGPSPDPSGPFHDIRLTATSIRLLFGAAVVAARRPRRFRA